MAFQNQKYTLEYPVQIGSELISEITLKRPKGKLMRKMRDISKGMSGDDLMDLIAALAGLAPSVVDEFDFDDLEAIGKIIENFSSSKKPSSN